MIPNSCPKYVPDFETQLEMITYARDVISARVGQGSRQGGINIPLVCTTLRYYSTRSNHWSHERVNKGETTTLISSTSSQVSLSRAISRKQMSNKPSNHQYAHWIMRRSERCLETDKIADFEL